MQGGGGGRWGADGGLVGGRWGAGGGPVGGRWGAGGGVNLDPAMQSMAFCVHPGERCQKEDAESGAA